jgi:hypothetical protein
MMTQHSSPSAVRKSGFLSSFGLLARSLPCAEMRFVVLLTFSSACIV